MLLMPRQFWSASIVCLAPWVAHAALPANPMDPSLPLSVHARAQCLQSVIAGAEQAGCQEGSVTSTRAASTGEARSDLRTGELRAKATSQVQPRASELLPGAGYAQAQMYDTLTVVGPVTTAFQGSISMTVDGTYFSSSADPWAVETYVTANLITLDADTGFVFSPAGIRVDLLGGSRPGDPVVGQLSGPVLGNVTTNMDPTSQRFDPADMRFTLTSSFAVTPQKPSFAFRALLTASNFSSFSVDSISTRETVLDFGQTARLSIDAPPGVTFVSDSGVFLVPIPEPASSALWMLGIALLLAGAARQRVGHPARRPRVQP